MEEVLEKKSKLKIQKENEILNKRLPNSERIINLNDSSRNVKGKEILSERAISISFDEEKMEIKGEISHYTQSSNSKKACFICYNEEPDAVLMKCGHGGLCYSCALLLWERSEECSFCRKEIKYVLQIDLQSKDSNVLKVMSYTYIKNPSVPSISFNSSEGFS